MPRIVVVLMLIEVSGRYRRPVLLVAVAHRVHGVHVGTHTSPSHCSLSRVHPHCFTSATKGKHRLGGKNGKQTINANEWFGSYHCVRGLRYGPSSSFAFNVIIRIVAWTTFLYLNLTKRHHEGMCFYKIDEQNQFSLFIHRNAYVKLYRYLKSILNT